MNTILGISLYPGLDNTPGENRRLLHEAAALGFRRVFTSLQIPETRADVLRREVRSLFGEAAALGLDIIADVSPAACGLLGIPEVTPAWLQKARLTTVRFDFGSDADRIAAFSRELPVQLNASTLRQDDLDALRRAGADLSRLEGLHNFYPHPHTGLSADYVQQQNALLHRNGLRAGLFLAGRAGRRAPLHEGLPTVEAWRDLTPALAAAPALATGCDFLILSESRPSLEEMQGLVTAVQDWEANTEPAAGRPAAPAAAPAAAAAPLVFHVKPAAGAAAVLKRLWDRPLTNRQDPAAECIRVAEGRPLLQDLAIPAARAKTAARTTGTHPEGTLPTASLPIGTLCVDNDRYGRYKGEVEILLTPRPADPRTNVLGRIAPEDAGKLRAVGPGTSFRLLRA